MNRIVASCLLAALVVLHGCSEPSGPKTVRVWGDVSYDGKPIEDGTIDFLSADGLPPAQATIKAGHYDLPASSGLVAEKPYRVEISALTKTGKTTPDVTGDSASTLEVLKNLIPPAYNAESTLKATTSSDESKNQFDFKLDNPAATKKR